MVVGTQRVGGWMGGRGVILCKPCRRVVLTFGCVLEYIFLAKFYDERGDGKVEMLSKPLLSHTWSPGFSFAKCHLEESAPYDGLSPFVAGVEAFARYARFWTRGYDVYTPTQNIVYHNYQPNPDGHGTTEWMKARQQRIRDRSLQRIRSFLGLPDGLEGFRLDNLGIYGIGKRRTLQQLSDFVGVDLEKKQSRPATVRPTSDLDFQYIYMKTGSAVVVMVMFRVRNS
jgi:hypothetical protein